jgi:hypothetical protein
MLRWLRVNRSRRHAALILGLTDENLRRLPAEPIGFHPGTGDIGRVRIEFEGTWYSLVDVAIVHGKDEQALGAWLESQGLSSDVVQAAQESGGTPVVAARKGEPPRQH